MQPAIPALSLIGRAELAVSPRFHLRDRDRRGLTRLTVPPLSPSIEYRVAFPIDQLPKRYRIDENGHRVLVGLSIEETFEFETFGELAPSDNTGVIITWRDGVPLSDREKRWLELYQKHDDAWKELLKKRVSDLKRK